MAITASHPAGLTPCAGLTTWKLDPTHSQVEFKVRHMVISYVKGGFTGLSGTLTEHPRDKTLSSIDATIDVNTISTGNAQGDAHLKSADFLDASQFGTMIFRSSRVQPNGEVDHDVTGDLTIPGRTRQQTFVVEGPTAPGKDPSGNTRIRLAATTKIRPQRLWPELERSSRTGDVLVGDEVNITIEAQFLK